MSIRFLNMVFHVFKFLNFLKFPILDFISFIKENLPFTELIWEFGDEDKPDWVHVAIAKGRENEKKIKIAERIEGKTKYKIWDRD